MDFDRLADEAESAAPIEPREVFELLPGKAPGYGYLRDVQAQILTAWHPRRDDRDIVVKVNTGGGKTIDGLVMLQSYLNEGIRPALYVAPDKYLVRQAVADAKNIGLKVVTDPESGAYLSGDAIAVVTADRLFNGRSIFSDQRPTAPRVPIGAVVIDDAHAVVARLRNQFSLSIPQENVSYRAILDLFAPDLKEQSPDALLDILEATGPGVARVPFWAVNKKIDSLRTILRAYKPSEDADFRRDAIREVVPFSRMVFTPREVTIVPPCPPITRITSFAEAQRRIFLTATLANDSVLVTDFDANPELVRNPIQPLTAGDIGERLILAPEEINPAITSDEVREAVKKLAKRYNVLVIVPSNTAMDRWDGPDTVRASAANLETVVAQMRTPGKHVGLVVVANKYDGIDLPQDACRVLVIDGLPEAFSGDERLDALMQKTVGGVDDRQVQRIEQGMGRGVRSTEDYCAVFLLGRRLAQLTVDPRTLERFSPATRKQLEASRTVAKQMEHTPLKKMLEPVQQLLDRDDGWIRFARVQLRGLLPAVARVDDSAVEIRRAFDAAVAGDLNGAGVRLVNAAEKCDDDRVAGRLLEQAAAYFDKNNPTKAQEILARARSLNEYVLRPLDGIAFAPLTFEGAQPNTMSTRLSAMYGTPAAMRVGVEAMLEKLTFDPTATELFEEGIFELGLFLGFGSQRPERQLGQGPDNLWALRDGHYWVIEAKSGATSEFVAKKDVGQLSQSMLWFGEKYTPDQSATPVMVHHSRTLYKDATPPSGMRIVNQQVLGELIASVRSLAAGLAADGWNDPADIARLLEGHKLTPEGLIARLKPTTGGTA
jgi:hypothetical protein